MRAALREAVRGDILDHIGDQALSLEAVARRQGISPVYVRKLLADDDTSFTDFVTMLRLSRAYRMLRDGQLDERTIASIALAVGFADPTYFNRVFRRRFGMTPSDVRKEAAAQRH